MVAELAKVKVEQKVDCLATWLVVYLEYWLAAEKENLLVDY